MSLVHFSYRLPDWIQRAVIVRRRSAVWLKAGIIFIHIPRAAGTSINYALYGQFMGHVRALDVQRWGSPAVKALPSFAVVRNPWERLVSAYRLAVRGKGQGGPYEASVWRAESYRIPEFRTFRSFVTEWLTRRDIMKLDGIFQSQSQFVFDRSGALLVDHLGRLENLGPTRAFLADRLGRVPAIGEGNRSGPVLDYRDFYTDELVDLVGRIYGEDVRQLGYTFVR